MNPTQVAIYARVSSEQQAETHTIASQVAALRERGDGAGARSGQYGPRFPGAGDDHPRARGGRLCLGLRPAPLGRWIEQRDAIYRQVMDRGWSPERQAFVQHYGATVLDSSLLRMSSLGFVRKPEPTSTSSKSRCRCERDC